jgi:hypothetical protein
MKNKKGKRHIEYLSAETSLTEIIALCSKLDLEFGDVTLEATCSEEGCCEMCRSTVPELHFVYYR